MRNSVPRVRVLSRIWDHRRGQTLVEFAVVAPILFLLVFGAIDFGRAFYTEMTLQHALREAGRFAVTGRHLPGIDPSTGQPYTRIGSIMQVTRKAAMGLDVRDIQISSVGGGADSAGGPGDTITVSMTTQLKLITAIVGRFFGPNGTYTFTVSTTFKNEPFDPGQTD